MFNDLNQNNQPGSKMPPVDDIFAETDKTEEAKKFSGYYSNTPAAPVAAPSEIDTKKAGLSAAEGFPSKSKGKILKIGLIVLLVILVISLGYLVYTKFFTGQGETEDVPGNDIINVVTTTAGNIEDNVNSLSDITSGGATGTTPISEETEISTSIPLATTTPPVTSLTDTDGDNLTDEQESVLGTDINLKDTDGDGLPDYDEVMIYNTMATKEDTDGDGLPDYDEIKIYSTDPLKVDSDGDTHNDGEEVKNGYNPLGAGKMVDANK